MRRNWMRIAVILMLSVLMLTGTSVAAQTYRVGDVVTFGSYPQDGPWPYSEGDIYWTILDYKDGELLLVSYNILDCKPFNKQFGDITWDISSVREWLNDDFLDAAFTREEQRAILETKIFNESNFRYGTYCGGDTYDKIFLLSENDAMIYFDSQESRIAYATDYAKNSNLMVYDKNGASRWLLRTNGNRSSSVCMVNATGFIDSAGTDLNSTEYGIRPAMWVWVGGDN